MTSTTAFLLTLTFLLLVAVVVVFSHMRQLRIRLKRRWLWSSWPVPKKSLADLDAALQLDAPCFDSLQTAMIMRPLQGASSTEILESWALSAAARTAKTIFEFGTCTGRTTLMLALNSPADAKIHTLTLHPDHFTTNYQADSQDIDAEKWQKTAENESKNTAFLYENTEVAPKVIQYFGDSKKFDETPLLGTCDLIFIDGGHSLSYVTSDTEKAMRMVAPGGLIFWHDYKHKCKGVFHYLNGLSKSKALYHIDDTYLVVYRAPR